MKTISIVFFLLLTVLVGNVTLTRAGDRQPIKAIYIPLADHYPGIVAYEKYRQTMVKADFSIERMLSWSLLRASFQSGEVDMAFIISSMALGFGSDKDVLAIAVPLAKSPAYIKKQNNRGLPASVEQSLPWADVVETGGFGKVAWYSKDVLPWPNGHVAGIVIVTDDAIRNKFAALREVIDSLHRAGLDIEHARRVEG